MNETDNRGRLWTAERICVAFRDFAATQGRPPKYGDLGGGSMPWPRSVERIYGSFNKAMRAAGFAPRPVGQPAKRRRRGR